MQMPSNSFLGHPGLQSNYQSMMIGSESQRLLPSWNYPPPPPPPCHTTGSAGSTSVFNCLPVDRSSSNDDKSILHQQLTSSSSPSSIPFAGGDASSLHVLYTGWPRVTSKKSMPFWGATRYLRICHEERVLIVLLLNISFAERLQVANFTNSVIKIRIHNDQIV